MSRTVQQIHLPACILRILAVILLFAFFLFCFLSFRCSLCTPTFNARLVILSRSLTIVFCLLAGTLWDWSQGARLLLLNFVLYCKFSFIPRSNRL